MRYVPPSHKFVRFFVVIAYARNCLYLIPATLPWAPYQLIYWAKKDKLLLKNTLLYKSLHWNIFAFSHSNLPWSNSGKKVRHNIRKLLLLYGYAGVSSRDICLNFGLSIRLQPYFVYVSNDDSRKSVWIRQLVLTFATRLCNNFKNPMNPSDFCTHHLC